MSTQDCTSITPACPVSATTYGYIPNLPANSTLLAIFAICLPLQFGAGLYYRTYSFFAFLTVGCTLELLGYTGRIIMHGNVWAASGFQLQIICLILGPSFIAAGVYLSLKHIVQYLGAQYSRLPPKYYTWIFIGCDVASIVIQAAGGGIAGAAGTDLGLLNAGNNLMIAGIAFQVVTMVVCGVLAVDFLIRYCQGSQAKADLSATKHPFSRPRAHVFFAAEISSYMTVLIRCIYRLPEMAGGWGNPLMQNEKEFLLLDGMMVAMAMVAFSIFHPGFWFPPMAAQRQERRLESQEGDILELSVGAGIHT